MGIGMPFFFLLYIRKYTKNWIQELLTGFEGPHSCKCKGNDDRTEQHIYRKSGNVLLLGAWPPYMNGTVLKYQDHGYFSIRRNKQFVW